MQATRSTREQSGVYPLHEYVRCSERFALFVTQRTFRFRYDCRSVYKMRRQYHLSRRLLESCMHTVYTSRRSTRPRLRSMYLSPFQKVQDDVMGSVGDSLFVSWLATIGTTRARTSPSYGVTRRSDRWHLPSDADSLQATSCYRRNRSALDDRGCSIRESEAENKGSAEASVGPRRRRLTRGDTEAID